MAIQATAPAPDRDAAGPGPGAPARRAPRRRVDATYYLFLLPAVALFTLAITVPAVMGVVYSFTDSIGFGDTRFIGLTNYAVLFSDPAILGSYGFTVGFALVTVVVVNVVAFLLAIGLASRIPARAALRTVFVLPMVVSGIVIAFVFNFLFSSSLPRLASALGIEALETSVLANADLAWTAIVLVTAWQAIPSALLVYTAGIVSIPGEVYEAASIDGASGWRRLRSITLPLLAGYVLINLVIGFKNFLNAYDVIVGLTDGGPGTATRSVAMTIFAGFSGGDYAYQMANATIFFLIALALALVQLRLTRGKVAV
ncbi:carbohydrate ABC transporter permease [Promicromonospora thailandica]|uniref:Raffinose/stachyose/melibiose transport system permease protein n=1 Tax=Promicromonospora thailandica TaxID=765201 RepID=A0A9X2JVK6_9MICO|nr:sugar ABC transporter permease [Promicromonospora thailandica]MCP2264587.1 raffinose/stachyose/melibiose transport system permease protein [Promicromonospora thailandica]BFF20345.1 sugar ABC transporter permease [Promicromonospora thailandica]